MHARVAAFENPRFDDRSLVDDLSKRARESAPQWQDAMPSALGHLMLVDRDNKRSLGITFFPGESEIREAAPVFERMGDEIPEEQRGRRTSVEVYEVVIDDVADGARAARLSSLEGSPDGIDKGIAFIKEQIQPEAADLTGWRGILTLADRRTGRAKTITFWDGPESLRASEERANELRSQAADAMGDTISGVERYEVALHEAQVSAPA
jgi:hypothetical protein